MWTVNHNKDTINQENEKKYDRANPKGYVDPSFQHRVQYDDSKRTVMNKTVQNFRFDRDTYSDLKTLLIDELNRLDHNSSLNDDSTTAYDALIKQKATHNEFTNKYFGRIHQIRD